MHFLLILSYTTQEVRQSLIPGTRKGMDSVPGEEPSREGKSNRATISSHHLPGGVFSRARRRASPGHITRFMAGVGMPGRGWRPPAPSGSPPR